MKPSKFLKKYGNYAAMTGTLFKGKSDLIWPARFTYSPTMSDRSCMNSDHIEIYQVRLAKCNEILKMRPMMAIGRIVSVRYGRGERMQLGYGKTEYINLLFN